MSLFEQLGGEPTLRAIVDDFVDRCFDDMMIGFLFTRAERSRIKKLRIRARGKSSRGTDRVQRPRAGRSSRTASHFRRAVRSTAADLDRDPARSPRAGRGGRCVDLPPGLAPRVDHQRSGLELSRLIMAETIQGLVVRSTAGFVDVRIDGDVIQARMRGRLKNTPRTTDLCVIGDRVMVSRPDELSFVVVEVLPRASRFSRRQPGRGPNKEDVLVANLDQLLITFCYGRPVLKTRLLDRFLVIAEHQQIQPVIVMNKADLREPGDASWQKTYESIGYRCPDRERGDRRRDGHLGGGAARQDLCVRRPVRRRQEQPDQPHSPWPRAKHRERQRSSRQRPAHDARRLTARPSQGRIPRRHAGDPRARYMGATHRAPRPMLPRVHDLP